jgi:hypothetical protein
MAMNKAFKDFYNSAEPEQKLSILRMEMTMPISTIQGYAALIKKRCESSKTQPAELRDWIDQIAEAANHLKELLDME